jgi:uncharacterized protein (TIGR03000 family)
MTKQFSRWLLIVALGLCAPALSPNGAFAGIFFPLEGGYARWYGWAGPLYGGFGGYPGARFINGAAGYGYGGAWGCDCWSGTDVGMNVVPSPATAPQTTAPGNSVIMNVIVPPDARVYINGLATTSVGAERRFRSDNLRPGSYPYQVRAEIERNGQKLVESKVVQMQTGEPTSLAFDFSKAVPAAGGLPTSLTLHVPEGAKVYLGDNPTRSTGSVRHFATDLKPGQRYSDYKVRVETTIGGKVQVRQEVISLAAGETRELKFDFAAGGDPRVASNNGR